MKKNYPRPAKCYICEQDIYGFFNKNGGTFYITAPRGKHHKDDCPRFDDNIQSRNFKPASKKKTINDPNQVMIMFDETKQKERNCNQES